jgi:Domain of unknown function (DUF5098)
MEEHLAEIRGVETKTSWLSEQLAILGEAYRTASALTIKAASVPRPYGWKEDVVAQSMVESSDRQNSVFKGLETLTLISANELQALSEEIKSVYYRLREEEKKRACVLKRAFEALEKKKGLYKEAVTTGETDLWKASLDLRVSLKAYLDIENLVERERRRAAVKCRDLCKRGLALYKDAYNSHMKSMETHYKIICNTLPEKWQGNECLWEEEEDRGEGPTGEERFNEAYMHILKQEGFSPQDVPVRGCGLFRHMRSMGISAPLFFVLSKKDFLHAFVVTPLLSEYARTSELPAFRETLTRAGTPCSFAATGTQIDPNEERELESLNLFLLHNLERAESLGGPFPVRLGNKRISINREKLEIKIEKKAYFAGSAVRLRGFTMIQVSGFYALLTESSSPLSLHGNPRSETIFWSPASFENPWAEERRTGEQHMEST